MPALHLLRRATTPFEHGLRLPLRGYAALYRTRRALAALDDHALRDVGLTRAQAEVEAARPFWDAPAHWFSR